MCAIDLIYLTCPCVDIFNSVRVSWWMTSEKAGDQGEVQPDFRVSPLPREPLTHCPQAYIQGLSGQVLFCER